MSNGRDSTTATRIGDGPLISTDLHPSIGTNIQGPSLIKVPGWIANPLGAYYLYFADHKGRHIRLAYADAIEGPWSIYGPGALQIGQSGFPTNDFVIADDDLAKTIAAYEAALGKDAMPPDVRTDVTMAHVASPDVHIDDANRRITMYFHGLEALGYQVSRVAVSNNGIDFHACPEILGPSYFRVFRWEGAYYALVMPGKIYRSTDGLTNFKLGPQLFNPNMRHSAVRVLTDSQKLEVYWTQVGDSPERIYRSTIDISGHWMHWRESAPVEVLRPERDWEGSNQTLEPSVRGAINRPVNQLRDPAIFQADDGRVVLLYACAGEAAIAAAELG